MSIVPCAVLNEDQSIIHVKKYGHILKIISLVQGFRCLLDVLFKTILSQAKFNSVKSQACQPIYLPDSVLSIIILVKCNLVILVCDGYNASSRY